eukprot:TRINITY_DN673_c0_g1_i2.p2 TRINITY_DN673_c0_g1~~TRINITY_DN673_c0_g1_i2.p2  ORF type:complete len:467 (+),score=69.40 TRINITY_DN673_c0_g1_i2:1750-3150(+)
MLIIIYDDPVFPLQFRQRGLQPTRIENTTFYKGAYYMPPLSNIDSVKIVIQYHQIKVMKEEKKGTAPELVNTSLVESDPEAEISETAAMPKKVKVTLFAIIGIVIFCFLIWLFVGRIESYSIDSENEDLHEKLDKKEAELKQEREKNENLAKQLGTTRLELEGIRNKNAQLHEELKIRDELIDELRGKVAEKEVENELLKETIKSHEKTIEHQKGKIEAQEMEIEELKSDVDKIYSDTRMIVSILNQELNRNQALTKEVDLLQERVSEQQKLIGNLTQEIQQLNEEISDVKQKNALQWVQLVLIEKQNGVKTNVKSVYKATKESCDSEEFYQKINDLQPNIFLATESSTGLIFGGYTSQTWENTEDFKKDDKAFTFSATYKSVCILNDPREAINTQRVRDEKKLLLTYGNYDIVLGDNCLMENSHEIAVNKTYECPNVGPQYFYTEEKNPTLSSFEFFIIDIEEIN